MFKVIFVFLLSCALGFGIKNYFQNKKNKKISDTVFGGMILTLFIVIMILSAPSKGIDTQPSTHDDNKDSVSAEVENNEKEKKEKTEQEIESDYNFTISNQAEIFADDFDRIAEIFGSGLTEDEIINMYEEDIDGVIANVKVGGGMIINMTDEEIPKKFKKEHVFLVDAMTDFVSSMDYLEKWLQGDGDAVLEAGVKMESGTEKLNKFNKVYSLAK